MPGNGGVYAVKRRKKPVQKSVKSPPAKTNPSKRHRDRLNGELDRLTAMLPFSEEVRGRLDKLSVLRLSVGYLKVKRYFHAAFQNHVTSSSNGRNGPSVSLDGVTFSESDFLLQALNGFVLVVTSDGTIFYTTPTIQNILGFQQSDVIHQSVYDFVHVDDREMFKCQLHFALNPNDTRAEDGQSSSKASSSSLPQYVPPENSSFLDRSFCCRLRCLLDNTSGFLALNFNGRLKYLQGNTGADGSAAAPQLALMAIATPLQPPSVMEIRTKTFIFQTKHSMDFAPVGIDTRGKLVLGYSEIELVTTGSGYQFVHAADMMYCADNHLRMMKTGDSGFTFFRLLTKTGHWLWVQANARVVFKGGRPDFIIARQKALTNEEGEEHLHQRRQQLPFNLATGEGVLYDVSLESFPGPPGSSPPEPTTEKPLDPASLLGSLRRQDHSVYTHPQKPGPELPIIDEIDGDYEEPSLEHAFLDSHALLSVPGETQASLMRSITGDLTSAAMMDSLEQILEDIEGIEGLEVDEAELRDWEDTVARVNEEREDVSVELNRILANDVFTYVEEALRRESAGFAPVPVSGSVNSSPTLGRQAADRKSGYAEAALLGDGLKVASEVESCSPCRGAHANHHYDNQMCSTQHAWLPSVQQNANSAQFTLTRQSDSTWWQQQQQQPSFHHHTLTHYSHGGMDSTAQSFQPQTGSCMYEKRDCHILNAAAGHNRPLGPPCPRGTMNAPFASVLHPGINQGVAVAAAGHTDVGSVNGGLAPSDYPPGNAALQSLFFHWNGEAQMPRVPLNGAVAPFAFPVLPGGSANLSQNSGS